MAHIVMAYIVMAYIGMAHIVIADTARSEQAISFWKIPFFWNLIHVLGRTCVYMCIDVRLDLCVKKRTYLTVAYGTCIMQVWLGTPCPQTLIVHRYGLYSYGLHSHGLYGYAYIVMAGMLQRPALWLWPI